MSRKINIAFFSDPGHGWARVPKAKLVKLGIADKITSFSYQRGINVFLEEDCDLTTYVNALKAKGYTEFKFVGKSSNRMSKIRGYESYSYTAPAPKTKVVKNLMTGKNIEIDADTPWCCNPASETFWSM